MGYIKFKVSRITDGSGSTYYSRVSRIESDMPTQGTLETNLIWHALSHQGGKCETWMVVDEGVVNRDHLAMSGSLTLDSGLLNIDLMQ